MSEKVVCITGIGSISPLGVNSDEVCSAYQSSSSLIQIREIEGREVVVSPLTDSGEKNLSLIAMEDRRYVTLDKSVLMAIYAARQCLKAAGWARGDTNSRTLISVGSSRGATGVFESAHRSFLQNGKVPVLTSPTTTLGNIASWVAQDLGVGPYAISHSMTCSTALEAVANGVAWLRGGLCDRAIVGGAEAPLTLFTISQMEALSIYGDRRALPLVCTPMARSYMPGSGMVLGEGSALFALELKDSGSINPGDIVIEGIGFGSESISHPISISREGDCLFEAMNAASGKNRGKIDCVVAHAPGTELGDAAELAAIKKLDEDSTFGITSNKWRIGHTLGASGALSVEYGVYLLENKVPVNIPYQTTEISRVSEFNRILVNSAGFGGHAISLLLALPAS